MRNDFASTALELLPFAKMSKKSQSSTSLSQLFMKFSKNLSSCVKRHPSLMLFLNPFIVFSSFFVRHHISNIHAKALSPQNLTGPGRQDCQNFIRWSEIDIASYRQTTVK